MIIIIIIILVVIFSCFFFFLVNVVVFNRFTLRDFTRLCAIFLVLLIRSLFSSFAVCANLNRKWYMAWHANPNCLVFILVAVIVVASSAYGSWAEDGGLCTIVLQPRRRTDVWVLNIKDGRFFFRCFVFFYAYRSRTGKTNAVYNRVIPCELWGGS